MLRGDSERVGEGAAVVAGREVARGRVVEAVARDVVRREHADLRERPEHHPLQALHALSALHAHAVQVVPIGDALAVFVRCEPADAVQTPVLVVLDAVLDLFPQHARIDLVEEKEAVIALIALAIHASRVTFAFGDLRLFPAQSSFQQIPVVAHFA